VAGIGQQRQRAGHPAGDRLDRCEAEGYRQRQAERAARRAGRVVVVGMAVTLVGMMSMVRVTGVAVAFAVVMGVPVVWRTGCGMRSHARL